MAAMVATPMQALRVVRQDSDVEIEAETHKTTRQKQIDIGKARPEYKRYLQRVPKAQRGRNDAHTPEPTARMSKRQFDRELGEWRRALHEYDAAAASRCNTQAVLANAAIKLSLVDSIVQEPMRQQAMKPSTMKWADQLLSDSEMAYDCAGPLPVVCAGTPPGSPPPMSPAGTPPGSPPDSDSEDEEECMVRTPSPSPDKYCHRDFQQAVKPPSSMRPSAKGRLTTLECKVLERRGELYSQSTSRSGDSTPSRISTSELASQVSSKDNTSSFFACARSDDSSDESVWGPWNTSGKLSPSLRPPAEAGLSKEQERHLTQWMQAAARELAQREDVQEQRLQDGLLAVRRLEKSVRKKLSFAKSSLEQRLVSAHRNNEDMDLVKGALVELRGLEERTSKAVSHAQGRASKTESQRRSAQVEDLRAALKQSMLPEANDTPKRADADTVSESSVSDRLQGAMLDEMRSAMAELQQAVHSQRTVMDAQAAELQSLRKQCGGSKAKPWENVLTPRRGRSPAGRC
eukprot:TRINITY_DN13047_c0_g1_i1.p1 TRINITY_DN13047_c0_g1~~TRINITY_DN13047_c0_g1_i1.p1  ORF type:complete len:517 (-),score=165.35 TRINITY_DN13047_c0_g1_i1:326-1876(-)